MSAVGITRLRIFDPFQHLVVEAGGEPDVHVDRIVVTLRETLIDMRQR